MLEDNSSIVVEKSPAQAALSYQNDDYCYLVAEGSPRGSHLQTISGKQEQLAQEGEEMLPSA